MRSVARWFVVVVVVAHGLIHLLGATKGLGWAEVRALPEPISPAMGLAWLAAAATVVAAGLLLAARNRRWWVIATLGAVASQSVILTSWNDAKTGTVANALLVAALGYTLTSLRGPDELPRRAPAPHRGRAR